MHEKAFSTENKKVQIPHEDSNDIPFTLNSCLDFHVLEYSAKFLRLIKVVILLCIT